MTTADDVASVRESRQATLADLKALMNRVDDTARKMSTKNRNRQLLVDCGWWLMHLGNRVVQLQEAARAGERRIYVPGE